MRAIRYSKELYDDVNLVYANDISESSVKLINENIDIINVDRNKIRGLKIIKIDFILKLFYIVK